MINRHPALDADAARAYPDANPVHEAMRTVAATTLGASLFRPTSRHIDRFVAAITGGRRTFVGTAAGLPVASTHRGVRPRRSLHGTMTVTDTLRCSAHPSR